MSLRFPALLFAAALAPSLVQAGFMNGDFETGDFTGWSQDTDGNGAPVPLSPDFLVVSPGLSGSNNAARLLADYWSAPGDTGSTPLAQVIFSNTLFQAMDTTVSPGFELLLSFDWEFGGQEPGAPDEDVVIGLFDGTDFFDADGNLGFLLSATSYGSGTFSGVLAPSYNNAAGFSLDFQLNAGFNGYGSYLLVDNVSITQQQVVPVPATALLLAPALGLIGGLRARSVRRNTRAQCA
jgi:hypothetical protein